MKSSALIAVLAGSMVLFAVGCAGEAEESDDGGEAVADIAELNAADSISINIASFHEAVTRASKDANHARVFIPNRVPNALLTPQEMFTSVIADRNFYSISLGGPDCGGANFCTVASFSGSKTRADSPLHPNTTVGGVPMEVSPGSCGASCSDAAISWEDGGWTYTLSANNAGGQGHYTPNGKRDLKAMAKSALNAGARNDEFPRGMTF